MQTANLNPFRADAAAQILRARALAQGIGGRLSNLLWVIFYSVMLEVTKKKL